MKRRPDAASRRPRVASSRDASRDARPPHTHTHTRVSCNTHDDDSIRCAFSTIRFAFSLDREYPSHCLPTHTKTHIESRANLDRDLELDGIDRCHRMSSMTRIDEIRCHRSMDDGCHRSRYATAAMRRCDRRQRAGVCVCAAAPRTSTFVSPSTIETRSSRRTDRIARTNRTRAPRTERPTETIQIKDTVIVTRH